MAETIWDVAAQFRAEYRADRRAGEVRLPWPGLHFISDAHRGGLGIAQNGGDWRAEINRWTRRECKGRGRPECFLRSASHETHWRQSWRTGQRTGETSRQEQLLHWE